MDIQIVLSDKICSVGWENDVMEVQFNDGSIYQYYNVSRSEYQNFLSSPSLSHELSLFEKRYSSRRVI